MASYRFKILNDHRFLYLSSIVGAAAFWPERNSVVRISQLLGEPDGGKHGQVTLTHISNQLIEGESCIHKLIPAQDGKEKLPRAIKPHKKRNSRPREEDSSDNASESGSSEIELGDSALATANQRLDMIEKQLGMLSERRTDYTEEPRLSASNVIFDSGNLGGCNKEGQVAQFKESRATFAFRVRKSNDTYASNGQYQMVILDISWDTPSEKEYLVWVDSGRGMGLVGFFQSCESQTVSGRSLVLNIRWCKDPLHFVVTRS